MGRRTTRLGSVTGNLAKRRRTTALAQDVDWTGGVDRPTGSKSVELATLLRRQFETLAGAIGFRSRHGPDRGASVLESPAAQCGVPRAEEVKGFVSGAGCSTDLTSLACKTDDQDHQNGLCVAAGFLSIQ